MTPTRRKLILIWKKYDHLSRGNQKDNDYENLNIVGNLKKSVGKGAVICLCPEIMPLPNSNAVCMPVWEIG